MEFPDLLAMLGMSQGQGQEDFLLQNILGNAGLMAPGHDRPVPGTPTPPPGSFSFMPPLGEEAGMPVLGPTPGVGMPGSIESGPPVSRMAQQPQGTGFFDKASGMFKQAQLDPMFQMGLSLLANSGPSLQPKSFASNLGMAGLQTMAMQRQQKMDDMKRKLIEAQTGLAGAKTIEALTGGGTSPLTEIGKLRADLLADRITQQEFDAKLNGIMNAEVQAKFENTQKLRVEYTKKVGGVEASLQTLNQAAALSAAGANPIAQLAGFISTIKSIDESTVREGELRTYFAAGGPIQELENLISRSQKEGFSETLRKDIIATIERLRGPLTRELERQRKFYGSEAEKFKLDPESIIGPAFLPVDMGSIGDEDEPMKPPPPGGDGQYDEEI